MIKSLLSFLCLMLVWVGDADASNGELSLSNFKSVPILHEGRTQPIDSVARFYFEKFSTPSTVKNTYYINWFANTLFSPEKSISQNIFYINHPENLGLIDRKNKLYSYLDLANIMNQKNAALQQILEKPRNNINDQERTLITLYEHYILYTQLLRSMTLFIPVEANKPPVWQSQEALSQQAIALINGAKNNVLLRVVKTDENLQSPWQSYFQKTNKKQLNQWQNLTTAYREKNTAQWNQALQVINKNASSKTALEIWYNKLSLLNISFILYLLTLLGLLVAFLKPTPTIQKTTFSLFTGAIILHLAHIILRSTILGRPPVGTLYESVIFVALTGAIICWFLYKYYQMISIFIGALLGSGLLTTAQAFIAEEPMGTLVAVLNTNFWLATHVLCITIGYGLCLLASVLAHIMILNSKKTLKQLLKILLIASLLFTVVGTVLGGIWADQSWGRFWGWDPKENGALLIVLWLAWILHGRMSGHLKSQTYLIATSALSIIVVMAWFGVNLLNIGLHSYGFISGIAWGISIFCTVEILLIVGLSFYANKQAKP